jgi:uncharacterized protein YjbI with pentapeptide repeats
VGARLKGTVLALADLQGSDFLAANLEGSALLGALFDAANLERASLTKARAGSIAIYDGEGRMTGRRQATSLTNANLKDATLDGFDIEACLQGAAIKPD